ncbi:PREDICTED: telomere repeat-binding protein 1-like isoform X2 [Camelina sativa]|uniref:Telomere repeat-binding protein 1-like isoform X2 n=1 Tax=Camelina sativa TaxID=90675 RepID=A0ABM0XBP1_CAMSA|nr:PREDICTED: telomere repeat-binding protein 1-like isoform X2 [Camelina sativa]
MVSHKCVEQFGYKDSLLPPNARAPRSARRRSIEKTVVSEDDNMCAIDLLATVAGHLSFESGSSLMSVDKLIEDHRLVTQNSVKMEFPEEDTPLMPPVALLSQVNSYQGSLSPCGFSSVINGKVEDEAEGFSYSGGGGGGGSDAFQVGNFSEDVKPGIDGDAVVLDARPNVVVSLGGSSSRTEVPSIGNCASHGVRDDVNLFSRDDDENFSGYIRPRVTKNSPRTVPRIGDRRIRKILASRHWKGSSRHADTKPWRNYYSQHQKSYPIKKRKYFDHISDSMTDDYRLRTKMHRGSRKVSSMKGHGTSFVSSDAHVKLRIKSFRVPELFIEIPEDATVGSLKRMVMEAVSTLLSDGHRVGLMVQGKKVRDDNKTLHQTGISQDNTQLDSLDFSLEPSSEMPQLLTSHPSGHAYEEVLPVCQAANLDNVLGSDYHDAALFPSDPLGNNNMTEDLKAMIPEALTDLSPGPLCRKPKKSEQQQQQQQQAAQRRIRRPFSVTEVEALVQAVEKLGTGRWRDVKVRAFEDADHRTYVDLKDKWKTLVHTAKISPQQRRGEPVPQELLDRVLNAHGYWTQQQMQLQQNVNKQQQETPSQTEGMLLLN